MAKIGDRVTVTIRGPNTLAGTATSSGTISIGQGATITIQGKIINDLGDNWEVKLDVAFAGNNRILIPKTRLP